jgi:short-subunit dehydrogenase
MPEIGPEQFDAAIDRHIFEVNTIGAITWLDLAAERMLAQRSGTIVGIGSVAGDRGRRGNPAYCASKAALHTFLESLRNRLSQHGVSVVTVKPGPVDTPMTAGRDKLPLLIDAERAAREIVAALPSGGTRYVPLAWAPIMTVVRSIPSVVFRRMNF